MSYNKIAASRCKHPLKWRIEARRLSRVRKITTQGQVVESLASLQ